MVPAAGPPAADPRMLTKPMMKVTTSYGLHAPRKIDAPLAAREINTQGAIRHPGRAARTLASRCNRLHPTCTPRENRRCHVGSAFGPGSTSREKNQWLRKI